MSETNRQIHELLADYATALRDGAMPAFLRSLTQEEARTIASCPDFWHGAKVVRILNSVGLSVETRAPNPSLFISHVNAKIASHLKKAKTGHRGKDATRAKRLAKPE